MRGGGYSSRGSFGSQGPRGGPASSGNGPHSYHQSGPSRRDVRNDRDSDRSGRSDRGGFAIIVFSIQFRHFGLAPKWKNLCVGGRGGLDRDESRRPRRRDDRRRVTDEEDTVMDSQEASSVDRGEICFYPTPKIVHY